jgi:microsomal epoxide hydrolase
LAAWIVEKFRGWSDCHGDVESRFSKDELLTIVMLYWATQSITSSMRLYCESERSRTNAAEPRVEVPTACAVFPRELYKAPRAWVEAAFNLKRFTVFASGGHFAALEEPATLVDDIRAFFRELR